MSGINLDTPPTAFCRDSHTDTFRSLPIEKRHQLEGLPLNEITVHTTSAAFAEIHRVTLVAPAVGMKPINDPIWKTRLQVMWIVFAALYSMIAKSHPTRELSSLLTVLAGALLIALLGHVLMETKQEKMRPVLLVAFGATVFVSSAVVPGLQGPARLSIRGGICVDDGLASCVRIQRPR